MTNTMNERDVQGHPIRHGVYNHSAVQELKGDFSPMHCKELCRRLWERPATGWRCEIQLVRYVTVAEVDQKRQMCTVELLQYSTTSAGL